MCHMDPIRIFLFFQIYLYRVWPISYKLFYLGALSTPQQHKATKPWWRHQMETFSALLAICAGNSPVTGEFPAHKPVTRGFDVFVDLRLNKRLSKKREAGDFRCHRALYNITVMIETTLCEILYTYIRKRGPTGHIGYTAIWVAMHFDKCMSAQPTGQYVASILRQGVAFTMTYNRFVPSGTKKSWLIFRYIRNDRKNSNETFVIWHMNNCWWYAFCSRGK